MRFRRKTRDDRRESCSPSVLRRLQLDLFAIFVIVDQLPSAGLEVGEATPGLCYNRQTHVAMTSLHAITADV
jgi:hypothetical protein